MAEMAAAREELPLNLQNAAAHSIYGRLDPSPHSPTSVVDGMEPKTQVTTLAVGTRCSGAEEALSAAGSERVRLVKPVAGWASKKCLRQVTSAAWEAAVVETGMARWAVDSSAWHPKKQDKSAEFQFLLALIGEESERKGVTQYSRWD